MRTSALAALLGCSLSLLAACDGRVDLGDRGAPVNNGPSGSSAAPPEDQTLVVGDPCIITDESEVTFPGFSPSEVTLETSLFPGKNLVCLVAHFRGRVSCPLGQSQELADKVAAFVALYVEEPGATPADAGITPAEEAQLCHTPAGGPGYGSLVQVPVAPQCASRPAAEASFFSCRCGGADPGATYCTCPSSFECVPLLELGPGAEVSGPVETLAGSYCVRSADVTTDASGQRALAPDPACQP